MSGWIFKLSTGPAVQLNQNIGLDSNPSFDSVSMNNATITNLTTTTIIVEGTGPSYFDHLEVGSGAFDSISVNNINLQTGTFNTMTGSHLYTESLSYHSGTFHTLSGSSLQFSNGSFTSLTGTNLTSSTIEALTGAFNQLYSSLSTLDTLQISSGTFVSMSGANLNVDQGSFTVLSSKQANVDILNIQTGSFHTLTGTFLNANTATVNNMYSNTQQSSYISSSSGSISVLSVSQLEAIGNTLQIASNSNATTNVNIATSNSIQTVNIGTVGGGQTLINLGGPGDTVNVSGTLVYVDTQVDVLKNPYIILNDGGVNINNCGIIIAKTGPLQSTTGASILVNSAQNAWVLQAGDGPTVMLDQNIAQGSNVLFGNMSGTQMQAPSGTITSLSVSSITGSSSNFNTTTTNLLNVATLTGTQGTITTLNVSSITGSSSNFITTTTNLLNVATLTGTQGTIGTLNVTSITGSSGNFSTTTTNLLNVATLTGTQGTISALNVSSITGSSGAFTSATIGKLTVSTGTVSSLSVTNIAATSFTGSQFYAQTGGFSTVNVTNALIQSNIYLATGSKIRSQVPTDTLYVDAHFNAANVFTVNAITGQTSFCNYGVGIMTPTIVYDGPNGTIYATGSTGAGYYKKIGIGTTSATGVLDARGTVYMGNSAQMSIGHDGSNGNLSNTTGNTLFYGPSGKSFIWHINLAQKMTLDSNGNLGIGTSTPDAKCSIVNNASLNQLSVDTGNGANGRQADIALFSTFSNFPSDTISRRTADILAGYNNGVWGNEYMTFNVGGSNDAKALTTERMRIQANGYVGIATTGPTSELDVNGFFRARRRGVGATGSSVAFGDDAGGWVLSDRGSNASNNLSWFWFSGWSSLSSELLTLTTSGNFGIGTTTPNAPLQFANTVANRKVVLYDGYNNDHQYYGLGINNAMLRYQVDSGGACHAWYAGSSASASAELMRLQGNGYLGLGTTSPVVRLHISESSTAAAATYLKVTNASNQSLGAIFGQDASNNVLVYNQANAALLFATNNTETMRISSAGNVGIGTNSPNAPLQFANTVVNRKIVLYEDTNNDHQYSGFGINSFILRYQVGSVSHSHVFFAGTSTTTSSELMRIQGNGFVGVGVSSPLSNLHVSSGAVTGLVNLLQLSSYTTSFGSNQSFAGILFSTKYSGNGAFYNLARVKATDNIAAGGTSGYGDLVFDTYNNFIAYERMRIRANGTVGINTSTPTTFFQVNTDSVSSVAATIGFNINPGTRGGGYYVGPALNFAAADFYGSSYIAASICGGNQCIGGRTTTGFLQFLVSKGDSGPTPTAAMIIANDGKVGINTTNPGSLLDIKDGSINLQGDNAKLYIGDGVSNYGNQGIEINTRWTGAEYPPLKVQTQSNNALIVTPDGTVGIGTASPGARLEIFNTNASNTIQTMFTTKFDGNWALYLQQHHIGGSRINYYWKQQWSSTTYDVLAFDSGNVGIGTTSIYSKFQVHGGGANTEISVTSNDGYKTRLGLYESVNKQYGAYVQYNGSYDGLEFGHTRGGSDTSPEMVIQVDTGNVGIGTTSPSYKLDLFGNQRIYNSSTNGNIRIGTPNSYTDFGVEIGGEQRAYINQVYNLPFAILTNSTERFRITGGGNVGIASTTPAGRLHVTTSGDNSGNAGGMGNWDSTYAVVANGGGPNNGGFGIGIYGPDMRINLLALQPGIAWMNLFYNANSHSWTYQGYLAMKFAYNGSSGIVALGLNYNSAYYPLEIGTSVGGLAINANGAAQFAGYWYQSDERIKTDIVPMPTSECLSTLQNIVISKYDYANIYAGSSTGVVGFIAQQLETVDENFVTKKRDFIANANTEVSLSLVSFSGSSGSYSATYTFSLPLSPSGPTFALGDCVRFFYINNPNNKFIEGYIIVSATEKEEQQYVFTSHSLNDLLPDTMFCFGKRVEDFHVVSKDRILSYSVGAIQDLSKQLEATKEELLTTKAKYDSLKNVLMEATSFDDLKAKLMLI